MAREYLAIEAQQLELPPHTAGRMCQLLVSAFTATTARERVVGLIFNPGMPDEDFEKI